MNFNLFNFIFIVKLIKKGITKDELERFKGQMKGKYLMNLQDIDILTSYNGIEYILYHCESSMQNNTSFQKDFVDYNDIYEKYIAPITKKQINEIIRRYFVVENQVIYILGETVPSIQQIHKIMV